MTKTEKLIERLRQRPKDFTWNELKKVLSYYGYEERSGKGSRRKFINREGQIISLHEPHPKPILKKYMIELVIKQLGLDHE